MGWVHLPLLTLHPHGSDIFSAWLGSKSMRAEGSVVSCRGQQDRQGDDLEATLSSHMMEQPVPWRKKQGYDLDMGNIYLGVWGSILTQEEGI